ncbi:MAG TPA: acetyltransferase [Candidatus Competibacteraceae bacterium]|nr:acetyltransferase [Candidatus Competibacteraceae bacterium]MCP5459869.1 acetyltransferase [Gammaproteobacteria bacterium]HPF58597.1 acetyltransferase [Candidatus Competibacteraceae bacterium]HRY18067.1 acetyltransferase [Candidatus Competibacteraceae bacterium]
MTNTQKLAEAIRAACIRAALEAYEEGGVLGLCAEGRWEYAISMLQQLDLDLLIECNTVNQEPEKHDK